LTIWATVSFSRMTLLNGVNWLVSQSVHKAGKFKTSWVWVTFTRLPMWHIQIHCSEAYILITWSCEIRWLANSLILCLQSVDLVVQIFALRWTGRRHKTRLCSQTWFSILFQRSLLVSTELRRSVSQVSVQMSRENRWILEIRLTLTSFVTVMLLPGSESRILLIPRFT
jgi:hypothetical protein